MASIGIDIGGTFTDLVLMRDDGSIVSTKAPTTPGRLLEGLLAAASEAAEQEDVALDDFLMQVDRVAHGTTTATNAFIERRGAKVALLTTRGFEDTIFMQRMMGMTAGLSTSELTDYSKRSVPDPLVPRSQVYGIRERVDYRGQVIGPLVEDDVRKAAEGIRKAGIKAVAVCFLWSFKNPEHEQRTAQILAEELPDAYLSISYNLVPRLGEYERTATTLVNAYLGPLIQQYTDLLAERLGDVRLFLLDSSGGVMTPAEAGNKPVRLLLSGPSGGVTAARFLGTERGHSKIITFDMGGTSTDVSIIVDGQAIQRRETAIGKYHFLLPMLDVRAIGAGGGSIASVEEGGYIRVGPQSAGSDPGPACYGHGGKLPTVTDADVVLGIIDPKQFLGGKLPLDMGKARQAILEYVAEPLGISIEEAAAGIKRIVDMRMVDLLRTVSIEQGHDPSEFVLYAFGGAGATHAPAFALEVVDEILVPASQSVFCAMGAVASDITFTSELAVPMRLKRDANGSDVDREEIESIFCNLEDQANEAISAQGVEPKDRCFQRIIETRFIRQIKTLPIVYQGEVSTALDDFLCAYTKRYGEESLPESAGFEFVTFIVEATGRLKRPRLARYPVSDEGCVHAKTGERRVFDAGTQQFLDTPIFNGLRLKSANRLSGPAIVEYPGTTVNIISGQTAIVDEFLNITIRKN